MKARSHKCPSCGKQHVPGFAFCQRCGLPLGEEPGGESTVGSDLGDGDAHEVTDLNGRILELIQRGKQEDAIRLYCEVLDCDMKVAEAAIDEMAQHVEFAEARTEARVQTGWLSGWLAAIRSMMGFGRG